jgi:hypothetical protein
MSTLRHIDILLICEICEGEIDLHESTTAQSTTAQSTTAQSTTAQSTTAQCRHCGIAFTVDALEAEQLSA